METDTKMGLMALLYKTLARAYGISLIGAGSVMVFAQFKQGTIENILDFGGSFFIAEGIGDLVTGKHHYLSLKLYSHIDDGIKYLKCSGFQWPYF